MRRHVKFSALLLGLFMGLCSCTPREAQPILTPYDIVENYPSEFSQFDIKTSYDSETAVRIKLSDGKITTSDSSLVTVNDNLVTIGGEGCYILSGRLSNGRIIVSAEKTQKVHLVLDGAAITSSDGPALYVESADKTVLTLKNGSQNSFCDALEYSDASMKGCIYSREDLTINGGGSLEVISRYNNGISCRRDLRIVSGGISISAVNNALKGNYSVAICGGRINILDCDDGIKADNDTKEGKGFVSIYGGEISISARDDAIQAKNSVLVTGCRAVLSAEGKKVNCDGSLSLTEGCIF